MSLKKHPKIPGYRIKKILAKGGMGVVYLAIQEALNRQVALKVTLPALAEADDSFTMRFVREAKATAALNHPNIITIYDAGKFKNSSYMAMEYIASGTLKDLDKSKLSPIGICHLLISICRGLEVAHQAGFVHRDIKPENILIDAEGNPLVTDFGIVKVEGNHTVITKTDMTFGTPRYMSPEQILGKKIDGRSDLYSLGIILFNLLEGGALFSDETPSAIYVKQVSEEPPPLSIKNKTFQPLITCLLNKNPDDRYKDANALIVALQSMVVKLTKPGERVGVHQLSNDATILTMSKNSSNIRHCEGRVYPKKYKKFIVKLGLVSVSLVIVADFSINSASIPKIDNLAGVIYQDCADCPEMITIPAGIFKMGSHERKNQESPIHEVRVKQFSIGVTEVTFAQWDVCYNAGGCKITNDEGWGRDSYPVLNVSWDDANEYTRWLSKKTGKSYRLPTESEWEYAARAGSKTKYNWGDSINCNQARYGYMSDKCDKKGATNHVKSFNANQYGLYDVHGNVWEWTADCWHNNYIGAPGEGEWKNGCIDASSHVLRGGSWYDTYDNLRSARRFEYLTTRGSNVIGFRLVRDL